MRYLIATFASILMFCTSTPAAAQSALQVRASEHPNYSRLVIPLTQSQDWVTNQEGREVVLSLPGQTSRYDVGDVFNRIPRTRLLAVRSDTRDETTRLLLTLACDCVVDTNRIGSRFLAVDIRRAEGGTSSKSVLNSVKPVIPRDPTTVEALPEQSARPALPQTPVVELQGLPESSNAGSDDETEKSSQNNALGPSGILLEIEQARQRLLSQVEFATSEGLLSTQAPTLQPDLSQETQSEGSPAEASSQSKASDGQDFAALQLRLRNALERSNERLPGNDAGKTMEDPKTCPGRTDFDLSLWLDAGDPVPQISKLRRTVIDNAGVVDQQKALQLARVYVALGFSAEARSVVDAFALRGPKSEIVLDLAAVFDDRDIMQTGPISVASGCPGAVTIWQLLAGQGSSLPGKDADDQLLQAFQKLPAHVRHLISGRLLKEAEAAGRDDLVSSLLTVIDRTPGSDHADLTLMRKVLETPVSRGGAEEITEVIEDLSVRDVPAAHQALSIRINRMLQDGDQISGTDIEDIEIAVRSHESSSFGIDLLVLLSRMHLEIGDLEQAFAVLDDFIPSSKEQTAKIHAATLDLMMDADPSKVGEAVFVRQVLSHRDAFSGSPSGQKLRLEIIEKLVELGLPNAGLFLLEAEEQLEDADHQLMRSQALAETNQSAQVDDALIAAVGLEAVRLRARDEADQRDYAAAFRLLSDLPRNDPQRSKYALLAGNWEDVDPEQLSPEDARLVSRFLGGGETASQPEVRSQSVSTNEADAETITSDGSLVAISLDAGRNMLSDASSLRSLIEDMN